MTIENDLNRIANALEAIAGNLDETFSVLSSENQAPATKNETPKRTRSKKADVASPEVMPELPKEVEELNTDTLTKLAAGELDPQPEPGPGPGPQAPVTQAAIADEFGVTESAEPEIKYADLNRKFFTLLTNVRDHKSADDARALALKFLEKFNNGKPISEAGLPKENYKPFNDKLDELLAKYPKLDKQEG